MGSAGKLWEIPEAVVLKGSLEDSPLPRGLLVSGNIFVCHTEEEGATGI